MKSDDHLDHAGSALAEPDAARIHETDLSYLTRTKGLENPDPDYPTAGRSFDVAHCGTCDQTDIEPEIQKCDDCGLDVCPHCCGTVYGYHETCRRRVDGEIDPLIERSAFKRGQETMAPEIVRLREDNERLRDFLRQGSRREDRLRAENAILRACAEHYAATNTWSRYDVLDDTYNPPEHGWRVAQEALAKAKEAK